MSIDQKVKLVDDLFDRLDQEIADFQSQSGLGCVPGCGKCCTYPEVHASPLEFLPWAYHLFLNRQAEEVLEQLKQKSDPVCLIYTPLSQLDKALGRCGDYRHRGLICRLFGYGASKDKYGQPTLVTCKIIKEGQQENYEKTVEAIKQGQYVPIFSDYYMQLSQIDYHLGRIQVPINEALERALEEVLQYYAYRPFPDGGAFADEEPYF